jgi:hypothetical protein
VVASPPASSTASINTDGIAFAHDTPYLTIDQAANAFLDGRHDPQNPAGD